MKPTLKRDTTKSLLVAFDDLMRDSTVLLNDTIYNDFLKFVNFAKVLQRNYRGAEEERKRLKCVEQDKDKRIEKNEYDLKEAKRLLDEAYSRIRQLEKENEAHQKQWIALTDMINGGNSQINNATLESIRKNYSPAPSIRVQRTASAKRNFYQPHDNKMEALVETSARSLLDASDLSFDDDSRDDVLDGSKHHGHAEKRRSSNVRKTTRRSHSMGADKIFSGATNLMTATATVSVHPNGIIDAETKIETPNKKELKEMVKKKRESRDRQQYKVTIAPPMESPVSTTPGYTPGYTPGVQRTYSNATPGSQVQRTYSNAGSMPFRPHKFQEKKAYGNRPRCGPCDNKIKIAKPYYACQDCNLACHKECRQDVVVSCLRGVTRTPSNKTGNFLADFAPLDRPMVPPAIEVCLEEVNRRGIREVGIYRIAGSDAEAKELLEKIIYGKGPMPDLSKNDIHSVTSCFKKFLRSLKEPIIHQSSWEVFVRAASYEEEAECEAAMYQAISELAVPNRDTLAYIILHLKSVADHKDKNKMDMDNLSKVMGPTIVGYSSPDPTAILSEAGDQQKVMKTLLNISDEYWKKLLEPRDPLFGNLKVATPETPAVFSPLTAYSPNRNLRTGGPARRTRSKQHNAKATLFQSPMIH